MSQKDYVDKMLSKYAVDTSKSEDTPMSDKVKLIKNSEDELFHDFDIKGKVGSLMYLAVCTRPDISQAVSVIARMTNHPSKAVCNAIDHLFAYLNKYRDLGIVFVREEKSEGTGHCDSDYAGDEMTLSLQPAWFSSLALRLSVGIAQSRQQLRNLALMLKQSQ